MRHCLKSKTLKNDNGIEELARYLAIAECRGSALFQFFV